MWRNDKPVEPQNITIGNFLPDQPGPEIGGQDRVDRGPPGNEAIFVMSSTGKTSYYEKRSGWGSIAYRCHNWDGSGADHLMIWRGPEKPALFDGSVKKVATFDEGYMMAGDINGDGTDEIIIFTESSASIYSNSNIDLTKVADGCTAPRPQQKRHYLFTRYWGGEYAKNAFTTGLKTQIVRKMSEKACPKTLYVNTTFGMFTSNRPEVISSNRTFILCNIQGRIICKMNVTHEKKIISNLKGVGKGVYLMQ